MSLKRRATIEKHYCLRCLGSFKAQGNLWFDSNFKALESTMTATAKKGYTFQELILTLASSLE